MGVWVRVVTLWYCETYDGSQKVLSNRRGPTGVWIEIHELFR